MEGLEPRPWNPARQCTGTNRAGERCQRNAHPGATVCILHGAAAPQVREAAKLRLLALVEPILSVFEEVVEQWRGTRCATCGRPTGDPAPVIRIGQLVLDRSGFHPSVTIEAAPPPQNEYADYDDDQIIEKLQQLLARAIETREIHRRAAVFELAPCGPDDVDGGLLPDAQDAVLLEEGFIVPDDEDQPAVSEIQNDAVQFPVGNRTPDESKDDK